MAAFEDMEAAACCLLRIIQDTPDLARSTKVAIAGEMAVRKYLPQYRHHMAGQSIDLIVNSSTSASLLRKKLLQHPMSPLVEAAGLLYYQVPQQQQQQRQQQRETTTTTTTSTSTTTSTPGIEVRITPEMLCPYLPRAAQPATALQPVPAHLPYVSLVDLIAFKMDACGLRDSVARKQHEARDAAALLALAAEHGALGPLDDAQARVVDECLPDVLRHVDDPDRQGKMWWQMRLRGTCDPDARKSPDVILTDLIEGMNLDEKSGGGGGSLSSSSKRSSTMTTSTSTAATEDDGTWWPKGLVGRTSSSSSKNSLSSSSSSSIASQVSTTASSALTSPCATPTSAHGPGFPPTTTHGHSRTSSKSDHHAAAAASTTGTCTTTNHSSSSSSSSMPPPSSSSSRRPRKFSTSQQSPVKAAHSRKKSADLRPRRHSQILGSLTASGSNGGHQNMSSPTDHGGAMGSPGLTLTGRFESTPGEEKLIQGSYF